MGMDDQLIGAALDYFGVSPAARAAERQRTDEDYARTVAGFEQGLTAKEQGLDTKAFEERFGPYRAAQLLGAEKTQAFQQAQQDRTVRQQVRSAAEQYLAASKPANIPGIGSFPQGFDTSHIAPDAQSIVQNQMPSHEDYSARIAALSPEQKTLLFGPQVTAAGLQQQQFNQDIGPDYDLRQRQVSTGESNASTNAAQLQATIDNAANRDEADALRTVAITHPGFSLAQSKAAARLLMAKPGTTGFAGRERRAQKMGILDAPGFTKPGPGGLTSNTTYSQMKIAARTLDKVATSAIQSKTGKVRDPAGATQAALQDLVASTIAHVQQVGGTPEQAMKLILSQARFVTPDGRQVVGYDQLPDDPSGVSQKRAAEAQVQQMVAAAYGQAGGAPSGLSPAAEAILARHTTGQQQAAPAALAPTAGPPALAPAALDALRSGFRPAEQLPVIVAETERVGAGGEPNLDCDSAILALKGSADPAVAKAVREYTAAAKDRRMTSAREKVRKPPAQR